MLPFAFFGRRPTGPSASAADPPIFAKAATVVTDAQESGNEGDTEDTSKTPAPKAKPAAIKVDKRPADAREDEARQRKRNRDAEKQREENAEKRRNRDITPADNAFMTKEREFEGKLADPKMTFGAILEQAGFTKYEMKLLYPATEKLDPLMHRIQQGNTETFKILCDGAFKDKIIMLETKLAMLYFGLPIEPMPYRARLGIDDPILGDEDEDYNWVDGEMGTFSKEPLKFLNSYEKRTYDQEPSRCKLST
jgi:hypothetical protein